MSVVAYYDAWRERQLEDYEVRNPRVVAALDFAKDALRDAVSVLDVGCGIGWTTWEMAETGKRVVGLDISPELIRTARVMFDGSCEFVVADFAGTDLDPFLPGWFDAVLMIDVYEHFPRERWPLVHRNIRNTGCEHLVLTMPTPETQQYARDHSIPLQPVDEDVTDTDVQQLAREIGGQVIVNRQVSIWRDSDYRHVHIRR